MITELVILVEGVIMGRVYEQTDRGGTLSFQFDPAQVIDRVRAFAEMLPDQIVAARDQALRQNLRAQPLREASELMLKHVEGLLRALR